MQNDDKTVEAMCRGWKPDSDGWYCLNCGMPEAGHTLAALQTQAQPEAPVTDGLAAELQLLMDLMDDQIELNPSNYDHDDACRLNTEAVEIHSVALDLFPRILTTLRQHDQGERDKALEEADRERAAAVSWLELQAEERGKKTQDGWALHWAADRIAANEHRALKGATQ